MASIERIRAGIVECHAGAGALDALPLLAQAHACRVAPDELLLVTAPDKVDGVIRTATAHLSAVEASTLVVDQSDAWAVFTLRGNDAMVLLLQLSANPFPETRPAVVQGAVAGGAAKVLLLEDAIHVLVPYVLRHHLTERLQDVYGPGGAIPDDEAPFGVGGPSLTTAAAPSMVAQ